MWTIVQIDRKTLKIIEDEVYDNITLEDLVEGSNLTECLSSTFNLLTWIYIELPENTPRFIILSYEVNQ